ncbi:hypothetical protein IMZ48_00165 [Candidatus Bathyarchaeota archaeon]|nr:hypothetical protein [Candidatus Bathyarchaeota archaeon]
MAPKKKGGKKGNDDWDAGLGESAAPQAAPAEAGEAQEGDDEEGAGGLMALMKKNKERRKKKGIADEFVQPEEPAAEPAAEPADKAPQEASLDDEFALPTKKGKGHQKNKPQPHKAAEETGDDGRILTKAEKEKLKKEREKQRKREQVCPTWNV